MHRQVVSSHNKSTNDMVQTKEQLFDKYNVSEVHNEWTFEDSIYSIELYRLMNGGELPPQNDKEILWLTEFLDRKDSDFKWWVDNVMVRNDWGSLYLTAKRMVHMLHAEIIAAQKNNSLTGKELSFTPQKK